MVVRGAGAGSKRPCRSLRGSKGDLLSRERRSPFITACPVRTNNLQILLHAVGGEGGVAGDGDGELDAGGVAEAIELVQEIVGRLVALAAGDLEQVVDEDVGNIIICLLYTSTASAR